MNYWKPEENCFVGDCMPFYENGTFHLYYLWDEGHHNHPIVGTAGGHQWAHASTRDLVHWEHHPMALTLDFAAGECSNCTGSLIEKDGNIYALYALRSKHLSGERFRIAVSEDRGLTFRKLSDAELDASPAGYSGAFRDPMAFYDENGLIHILITTSREDENNGSLNGEIAHFTTTDLIHYNQAESFLKTWNAPECCDYFKWGDFYYLLFSVRGETHYRFSREPFGPWICPELDFPACPQCRVMKTAQWKDNRRIAAGWCATWEPGNQLRFAGRTVFRELIQNPDGTLGTAFVPEMSAMANSQVLESVSIASSDGFAWKEIADVPESFLLEGKIRFSPETNQFGFMVADREQKSPRPIEFYPRERRVEVDRTARIGQVPLEKGEISFRLIRQKDVIDLEINGNRTVVSPNLDLSGSRIIFYVNAGNAAFENMKISSKSNL